MDIPQHPFTTDEATAWGLSRQRLARLTREGVLVRPFKGVYHPATIPDTLDLRAECAQRVLSEHMVVADRSAAWLHGVDVLTLPETRLLPRLEVVSTAKLPTRCAGIHGGERELCSEEVTQVRGVPVTTPLRTAVDLACLRGGASALAAVEALMRGAHLTRPQLRSQLLRHGGRRGVIQARTIAEIATPDAESPGESFLKWFMIDAGLPPFVQQFSLLLPGFGEVRLDFALPELKIAAEYDGEEFHGPEQRHHDETRRGALVDDGWLVVVARKDDLSARHRERWLQQLGSAVRERTPQFRRTYPPSQPRVRR